MNLISLNGARRPGIMLRALLVLIAAALLAGCQQLPEGEDEGAEVKPEEPGVGTSGKLPGTAGDTCDAEAQWVTHPSEPKKGEFAFNSPCSFHQWAYKSFLWLTSEDPKGGRVFENFADPTRIFRPEGPAGTYPGRDQGPPRVEMLARVGKSRTSVAEETVFQAGPGSKVLVDQAGQVVYYSLHINEAYWDFIADNQLWILQNLESFPPDTDFPPPSFELKASWRVAEAGGRVLIENASQRFHTVETVIPKVTVNDQGLVVQLRETEPATMALVGLHVTGVVEGHPEFIWATFIHVDSAPSCEDVPAAGPGPAINPRTGQPWSFYDGKASRAEANQFDVSDPLAVVNVCDVHPQGGGEQTNVDAIKQLNASVHALEGDSLWANYELEGGIWTTGVVPLNNGAFSQEDVQAGAAQKGSLDLANSTMETFTQDENCFACHNGGAHEVAVHLSDGSQKSTEVGAKNINLSHFVVNYQATRQLAESH